MFITDPELDFVPIPDSGVEKALDHGSRGRKGMDPGSGYAKTARYLRLKKASLKSCNPGLFVSFSQLACSLDPDPGPHFQKISGDPDPGEQNQCGPDPKQVVFSVTTVLS
jgi:hypothetical protein